MREFREYLKKYPIPNGAIRCVRVRNRSWESTLPGVSVTSELPKENDPEIVPVGRVSLSSSSVLLENATLSIQKTRTSNVHATPQSAVVDYMHLPTQAYLTGGRDDHVPDSGYTFLFCLRGFGAMVKKLMW